MWLRAYGTFSTKVADRGGRGGRGRGGRGSGPQDTRGGGRGGGYQDGRGGGRGSPAGSSDFRGGRGRGDGNFRGSGRGDGGRGDFRGGFSGPRGGRGGHDRGRGGSRGGRGGFGGQPEGPSVFTAGGIVPPPDAIIAKLEDEVVRNQTTSVAQLTSKMSSLSMEAKQDMEKFPPRPAFGNKGTPVTLWANYYEVKTKAPVIYKYTMTVKEIGTKKPEETKERAAKPKGKGGKPGKPGKSQQSGPRDVKGRKLYLVIKEALNELTKKDKTLLLATEFKSQLISLRKLDFERGNSIRFNMASSADSEKTDLFEVTFNGPAEARVDEMLKYINSKTGTSNNTPSPDDGNDPARAMAFPKFPDVIDALNIIFGFGPRSKLDEISAVGSSRFFAFERGNRRNEVTLGRDRALKAARGYFQSVRLGTGRLLLNVNVTHGVFKIDGPCTKLFDGFGVEATASPQMLRKLKLLNKFLPKTRVWIRTKYGNGKEVRKVKALHGLVSAREINKASRGLDKPPKFNPNADFAGPRDVSFWMENEGNSRYVTVADYYKQKYSIDLANYPLFNVGTAAKPTFVPAEFLEILPGQSVKAKLNGAESTDMVNFACRTPYANALSITTDARQTLGLDEEVLGQFGIQVGRQLLTVQGRVLTVPRVAYLDHQRKPKPIDPHNGAWNMRDVKVFKPGKPVARWTYVNLMLGPGDRARPVGPQQVHNFAEFMTKNMNITVNKPVPPPIETAQSHEAEKVFAWAQNNNIELILVILGTSDSQVYGKIKTLGDCTYGIHTICVQGFQLGKGQPQYFANVALKWNLKTGGVNHKLLNEVGLIKEGRTMVVGYDVTHPTNMSPDKSDAAPSLVGLVATVDRDMGQWPAYSWEQSSKQEMLDETLTQAFESRLELWQKHNRNELPENIVIFRDGVSTGQFAQVLRTELPRIRIACNGKYPKNKAPKISIIVSVKRHSTRFYPTSEENAMEKNNNTQNGTVVDRGITEARYWDFYLTAHASIKGTARPAHYTVLLDEIFRAKFKDEAANELEKFTHELCYLFGRATKAVSICPPAYYADIVCTRARAHRPEFFEESDGDSVITAGSVHSTGKKVHPRLVNSMYYI
ncbi:putative argonaute like post-transcriptional gene silencing QDE-2 protein [Fusarium beomiforme]|uniref:Argonaute like post-transcriptional gene silencing QDE-2 protein n=1 Tax=Fusarium beomiforme TaxID=44412 RepID=A0A9P5AVW6_9HYPO|nr:putative argonaute like post-transcriptional gene silencing QDE-2 protein [Fusarium beomiforme]